MVAKQKTVTVEDRNGDKFEVPAGLDGKNPVSPNNPAPGAVAMDLKQAKKQAADRVGPEESSSDADLNKIAAKVK